MDSIPHSLLGQAGLTTGLLGVVLGGLWAILTGKLVPSRELDLWKDLAREKDRQMTALTMALLGQTPDQEDSTP